MSAVMPLPEVFTRDDSQARICSSHFREQDFYVVGGKRRLKCDAVPSISLRYPETEAADKENIFVQSGTLQSIGRENSVHLLPGRIPLSEHSHNVSKTSIHRSPSIAPTAPKQQVLADINKDIEASRERATLLEHEQVAISEANDTHSVEHIVTERVLQPKKKRKL